MAGEFLRSFANVLLQLGSERSGLIFGQRFLREESVSVSEKRNCSPTPLVNLRWTQLSENFLLIRKDPSAISEKRQPLEKNFPFKLEICYEERLEILQEEICNFEESSPRTISNSSILLTTLRKKFLEYFKPRLVPNPANPRESQHVL